MDAEFRKKFFTDTADTGRFRIVSHRTGKEYFIEPIGDPHVKWGSVDPASGELRNKKGAGKYRGSIDASESLIKEENGFKNIQEIPPGVSPFAAIELLDAQYPDKYCN